MDIVGFYKELDPNVKQNTINWRVYTLVQMGVLARISRGKFVFGETKKFIPEVSSKLNMIYNKLKKELPYIDLCVWNTSIINEFMLHQPGKFFTLIEVSLLIPIFSSPRYSSTTESNRKSIFG